MLTVRWTPLVRMALIHYKFESIHPFYDGNGRAGRILNILYLVKEELLDSPILYLSRYINQTKSDYYKRLQEARPNSWEPWLLYMIRGIELTSVHAAVLVEKIGILLQQNKRRILDRHKFYSQDLLNSIFRHPYTKAAFLEKDLRVSRPTATRYLNALASDGILSMHKLGRENYYVNRDLVSLFMNPPLMAGKQ